MKEGGKRMSLRKTGIILLALLLAAMVMVPMVSADAQIVSKGNILDMKYLETTSLSNTVKQMDNQETFGRLDSLAEYAFVTVNSSAFMNDADKNNQIVFIIHGEKFLLQLQSVPSPIDKNAKIIVSGPNGESKIDFPVIKT